MAELELAIYRDGTPLLNKRYLAHQTGTDNDPASAVNPLSQALDNIFVRFSSDAHAALLP